MTQLYWFSVKLRFTLNQYSMMRACDAELETKYHSLELPADDGNAETRPPKPRKTISRKNQTAFDLTTALYQMVGVDLTQIHGVDALTAQVVLSEIGTDLNRWPTVKHFASWLGLCPQNRITGGKVKQQGTAKTKNRAYTALRVAAQALWHSRSANGAFYRRLRAKHGPAKATTATAHRLARIIYHMLKNRTDYIDPGLTAYEEQHRERAIRSLKRRAARLGLSLTPTLSDSPIS